MAIYYISGLGATEKAFVKLNFVRNEEVFYVPWIAPQKGESISDYALRMAEFVKHEDPILIGLSFGGMMAIEIAKHIQVKKIILISSAKTKHEIPFYYKLFGRLKLYNLLPISILKKRPAIFYYFLGCQSEQERNSADDFLQNLEPGYMKWAVKQICVWKNQDVPKNVLHFHGTSDLLLPFRFIKDCEKIDKGNHFMIVNKSSKINPPLNEALGQL